MIIRKHIITHCTLAFALLSILPFLFLTACGPSNFLAKTDTSEYCKSCHVMQAEYEAWIHSGAHRRKVCTDCHLPNENKAAHYLWKSIDGLKDVIVFHSGKVPDQIKISSHGEKVLQANCIRCHETTVMMIDIRRKCWDCHRNITHMHTGIRETI
jgi:cytochrome c nitrite reductase small subunit